MIKANELRIGNWVCYQRFSNKIQIDADILVSLLGDGLLQMHSVEPIPLTPEVLEKCGFIKNDKTPFIDKIAYSIFKDAKKFVWCEGYILKQLPDGFVIIYENIYYLHNIQNVIALTGTELIINL